MSSPTKAPVEQRHRELAAHIIASNYAREFEPDEIHCQDTIELHRPFVAQALADLEAAAYARGLADGAERERAAAAKYVHDSGYHGTASNIESGKHLEKSE